MSEILNIVVWYLAVTIIGLTALPVLYRLLPGLPLRGFALARPLGLLLWGFIFWLLASLGVLQNDLGGEILAFVLLLGGSIWALRGGKHREILAWCQQNLRTLLTVEGLFLLVFIFWVLVRGMNPEVTYTEKPMELAFINSILRSEAFPPQDPWLSDYAISYYYFGYILIAMLTRITGTASAVAFNLASATWLALTAAALYGIVYDITSLWAKQNTVQSATTNERFSRNAGLLGPLFVLVISTIEGVLEFLHAGGVFWRRGADGLLTSKFWSWLSILDLNQPPSQPFDWVPSRASGWLWWRGSRVLQDLTLGNQHIEVIDEFPFFSYLLSDLHPHVLAMPFTLLVIALAMNLFIGGDSFLQKSRKVVDWFKDWTFWLTALIFGSLAFINTWDFPIYVGLFCLVWAFKVYRKNGWNAAILWDFLKNGFVLGIAGVLLYLPFYIGFDSQAGGILPSLAFMTRGVHFWVLFAALLIPILIFCLYFAKTKLDRKSIWTGAKVTLILLALLFIVMMIYGALLLSFQLWGPLLAASQNASISALGAKMSQGGNAFAGVYGGYPAREILSQAFLRRLLAPGTWLTLGFLLTITLGALLYRERKTVPGSVTEEEDPPAIGHRDVELFILILVLFGLLLTVFPEFFYLRDQFGTRMNTIFKFYFQAWIFWGIAAAAGSAILFRQLRGWRSTAFQVLWIVTLLAGMAYPSVMLWNKTNGFSMEDWTLDGNAYIQRYNPDEYDAILWLQNAPLGIVVEAVGGSYTDYARISTRTGLPTILGWPGHESQWRGGGEEMGSRLSDIQVLFETGDWEEALRIMEGYNVRYIYIGNLERSTYRLDLSKFEANLSRVFANGSVTIFEVPGNIGIFFAMNENRRRIKQPTLEFLAYLAIFMVAGAFRFALLGNLPLDDHEAGLALQALQWSRGDAPLLTGEPGYIPLTTILLFIFSATELSARFWPALAGTLVVLVPLLYRDWLGRFTALMLAVLLAIDPILIGVSRSAEGSTLALLGLLAAIGFVFRKHPLLSGISFGVAVLGGIGFWPGFIILGGLVLVYMKTDGNKESEEGSKFPSWRSLLPVTVTALITVVVVSTLLLTNPRGISAMGSAFADYLRSWGGKNGSPVLGVKIAWLLSLMPMMVFAIWSFIEGLIHRDKRVKWLGIWAATAMLLALVNPSRQLFDLFWVSIPLLSLAAIKLAALFSNFEVESRIVYLAEAGLVVALVVFSFLNAIYLVNNPLLNQEEYRNRVIGMILPLILLIGMTVLLAWGWSGSSTRKGFISGVVILAIFAVLSGTWKAAGLGSQPTSEIRRGVGVPVGAEELLSTIEDISRTKTGIENRIDIQLIDLDLPSINWVLRDFEQIGNETIFNPNLASSIILTPVDLEIEASASYRGQKVLWQVAPDIDNMNFTDWMRWTLFRTAPTKKTEIILWARNDLFPGGTTP